MVDSPRPTANVSKCLGPDQINLVSRYQYLLATLLVTRSSMDMTMALQRSPMSHGVIRGPGSASPVFMTRAVQVQLHYNFGCNVL